jgi:23S rRNA (adenine2503-C2)-methyltransferase
MSSVVVVSSENVDEKQQSLTTSVVQAADKKVNLLGMSRAELEKFFEDLGEKKFRASQVMKWIHQFFVTDFAEMSNISGKLREKLEKICEIKAPEVVHRNYSKDGTRKWVFRVGDGEGSLVETVLIPAEDKTGARKTCVFHHKWVVHWIVHSVRRVNKVSNVI